MNIKDVRFREACFFAFEFVLPLIDTSLSQLAKLYSGSVDSKSQHAYAVSLTELIMVGTRTMTKFHRFATDTRDDVDHFVRSYFPPSLHWEFKQLYRDYEQGILFYQGFSGFSEDSVKRQILEWKKSALAPEKLFKHFTSAMEAFRKELLKTEASEYRDRFFHNYEKLRKLA